MGLEKAIADKYIGRDGSPVGKHRRSRELTRAAVLAAQTEVAGILNAKSPLTDRQMHSVLLAAVKASPEIFNVADEEGY